MHQLVNVIYAAARDKKVIGIIVTGNNESLPMPVYEEIRSAFKGSKTNSEGKKFMYFYSDTIGELSKANSLYWLASVFDKIYMSETGFVTLCSYNSEVPFVRNMLDKVGILPQITQLKDYKSAADFFLRDKFTDAHKEMITNILESFKGIVYQDIADSRKITLDEVNYAFENAPFTAAKALELKLVFLFRF